MMRSLFSGVAGLRSHQTGMDVIGNNIANVNTVGFKGSRVNFQDVLSQTVQGASSGQSGRGGTNPIQIGLGTALASVDTVFTDGSFQATGKQTDLAIQGQGFFILSDGTANNVYTRAGAFDFDRLGNLLVPGTGYKVMGWTAGTGGTIDTTQDIEGIQIPVGSSMAPNVTSELTFANNLNATANADATSATQVSISCYDDLGNAHKLSGTFQKTGANTWTFTPTTPCDTGATAVGTSTLVFDPATGALNTGASTITDITITPTAAMGTNAFTITMTDAFSSITQYGQESDTTPSTVAATSQDGYAAGTLQTVSIDPTGVIYGKYSNGQNQNLAQIALATFNNPGGLTKSGDNLFVRSSNSGEPQVGTTSTGGRGKLSPGTLEMSNVDLSREFSSMIITQRGFQANSKIISVTDEMLQELANLKR